MLCRAAIIAWLFTATIVAAQVLEPGKCQAIHGRAHLYGGDGQLRIWHIGTHHEFEPDSTSWNRVVDWLDAGVPADYKDGSLVSPTSMVTMYADFLVCPTEPFRKGAVQPAVVKSISRRHYVVQPKVDE